MKRNNFLLIILTLTCLSITKLVFNTPISQTPTTLKSSSTFQTKSFSTTLTSPISISLSEGIPNSSFPSDHLAQLLNIRLAETVTAFKQSGQTEQIAGDSIGLKVFNDFKNKLDDYQQRVTSLINEWETLNTPKQSTYDFSSLLSFAGAYILHSDHHQKLATFSKGTLRFVIFRKFEVFKGQSSFFSFQPVVFTGETIHSLTESPVYVSTSQQSVQESSISSDKNTKLTDINLGSFDIEETDLVIVGSQDFFDNMHLSFLTFTVNYLVLNYALDTSVILTNLQKFVDRFLEIAFVEKVEDAIFKNKHTLSDHSITQINPAGVSQSNFQSENSFRLGSESDVFIPETVSLNPIPHKTLFQRIMNRFVPCCDKTKTLDEDMFVKARKNLNPDPKTLPSNDFESYEKRAIFKFAGSESFNSLKTDKKSVDSFDSEATHHILLRQKLGANNEDFQQQNKLLDKQQKLIVPVLLSENRNRILSKIQIDSNDQSFARKLGGDGKDGTDGSDIDSVNLSDQSFAIDNSDKSNLTLPKDMEIAESHFKPPTEPGLFSKIFDFFSMPCCSGRNKEKTEKNYIRIKPKQPFDQSVNFGDETMNDISEIDDPIMDFQIDRIKMEKMADIQRQKKRAELENKSSVQQKLANNKLNNKEKNSQDQIPLDEMLFDEPVNHEHKIEKRIHLKSDAIRMKAELEKRSNIRQESIKNKPNDKNINSQTEKNLNDVGLPDNEEFVDTRFNPKKSHKNEFRQLAGNKDEDRLSQTKQQSDSQKDHPPKLQDTNNQDSANSVEEIQPDQICEDNQIPSDQKQIEMFDSVFNCNSEDLLSAPFSDYESNSLISACFSENIATGFPISEQKISEFSRKNQSPKISEVLASLAQLFSKATHFLSPKMVRTSDGSRNWEDLDMSHDITVLFTSIIEDANDVFNDLENLTQVIQNFKNNANDKFENHVKTTLEDELLQSSIEERSIV